MDRFVVSIVAGALFGGTYALIGLGIVLAFRATAVLTFAQGQLMLLGAYIVAAWQVQRHGSSIAVMAAAIVVVALVGVVFYLVVLQRTAGLPHFMGFAVTLGFAAILDGVMGLIFSSNQYTLTIPGLPDGAFQVLGARVSEKHAILALLTFLLAGGIIAVLRFTPLGVRVRAAGQDAVLASQGGINVRLVYGASWALAGGLAAVAGIVFGSSNVVDPQLVNLVLAAFPVILLGGLDSIEGALVGGILIGITQGFVATYWGGEYLDIVTYSVLLAVILVRPQGLFGTRVVTRA